MASSNPLKTKTKKSKKKDDIAFQQSHTSFQDKFAKVSTFTETRSTAHTGDIISEVHQLDLGYEPPRKKARLHEPATEPHPTISKPGDGVDHGEGNQESKPKKPQVSNFK